MPGWSSVTTASTLIASSIALISPVVATDRLMDEEHADSAAVCLRKNAPVSFNDDLPG
jgi:hypothetical protein